MSMNKFISHSKRSMKWPVSAVLVLFATACANSEPVSLSDHKPTNTAENTLAGDTAPLTDSDQKAIPAPLTGTVDGVPFNGTLRIVGFVAEGQQILALGNLTDVQGALSEEAIGTLQSHTFQIPVTLSQSPPSASPVDSASEGSRSQALLACDILFLQLAPLDLDLLGLVVHLDQVTLDIDGQTGAGDLVGNLLCAITSLLDPIGFLQNIAQIVGLLNDLIGAIGEL